MATMTIAFTLCLASQGQPAPMDAENGKATATPVALTDDEIAAYRTFLTSYSNGSPARMNLANRTIPFKLSESDRASGCLRGIVLPDIESVRSMDRTLDPKIVVGLNAILVDPERQSSVVRANDPSHKIGRGESVDDAVTAAFASGLLQVSEITFDRAHKYAVMRFSFSCGMLCGHGGTVVLRSVNGQWKVTKRRCSSWVS